MSVQDVITALNAPAAVSLSQPLIVAGSGAGLSAVWGGDWAKAVFSTRYRRLYEDHARILAMVRQDQELRGREAGVVQIQVTRETQYPLIGAALATFGVTHKPPVLNHAGVVIPPAYLAQPYLASRPAAKLTVPQRLTSIARRRPSVRERRLPPVICLKRAIAVWIVCSQSPKRTVFPIRTGRDHVADLDLTIGGDHVVDQQLSHFTNTAFTGLLLGNDIAVSMDGHGAWRDNVFIERLWRSVKYEEVYLRAYDSVGEARASIGRYMAFYNGRRPHSSLDARTPDQAYFNHVPLSAAA